MFDKRQGFFQRLAQRLDKIDKNEGTEIISLLLEERSLWTTIAEHNPVRVAVCRGEEVIFDTTRGLYQAVRHNLTSEPKQTLCLPNSQDCFDVEHISHKTTTIFYFHISEETVPPNLKDSVEALEILAAGISHEIKNPLTAIDIHTQVIERRISQGLLSVPREITDYVALIKGENARLLSVLETFIGTLRKRRPVFTFCEAEDILISAAKVFGAELREKNISLHLDLKPVPKIFTSAEILQQIAADLLRNAIEALEDAPSKHILITLGETRSKDGLAISIEDSGPGIPLSQRKRVFEPYYTTKKSGSGLGLTLVKKMGEELGGEIFLEESSLGGAALGIKLPFSREQKKLEYR